MPRYKYGCRQTSDETRSMRNALPRQSAFSSSSCALDPVENACDGTAPNESTDAVSAYTPVS